MKYKAGFPFWKLAAKLGFKIEVVIVAHYDPEYKVFIAKANYLKGFIIEAESFDLLNKEIQQTLPEFLSYLINNDGDKNESAKISIGSDLRLQSNIA